MPAPAGNWKKRVEAHEATRLTGSFAVHDGVAFVPAASWEETRSIDPAYPCCTFRGSVTAVRVRDGSVVWKTYLVDPPKKTGTTAVGTTLRAVRCRRLVDAHHRRARAACSTSPPATTTRIPPPRRATPSWRSISRPAASSGRSRPRPTTSTTRRAAAAEPNCPATSGPDFDYGSSALLVRRAGGRDVLVAGQKSGVVYGLDPAEAGQVLWQTRVGAGGTNGGVQWGMASDGHHVYAAVSDVGASARGIGRAPHRQRGSSTRQGGGLTALDVADGAKVWFAPARRALRRVPVAARRSRPP